MIEILLAFIADLYIGDPVYRFHPVRIMGKGINQSEIILRRLIKNNYIGGFLLAIIIPVGVFIVVGFILYICFQIHPLLAGVINILGIYASISVHDLRKEAMQIYTDLQRNDLVRARKDLSRIVGRDTKCLDDKEITRATIETVAESTVDGIVSPLFYAALGGAPLTLAYKAVNTLDSMIGYINEPYKEFGYFSAKMDDVVNWIPARLSYVFICIAALLAKFNLKEALAVGAKEVRVFNNISNLPEATFAGALQVRLGGVNVYQGKIEEKACLGAGESLIHFSVIQKSVKLMVCASWVTLVFCLLLHYSVYNLVF